jgi:outer membrane lipoprotein SlyB
MTKQRITVNFKVIRDEGDTIVIMPHQDATRIKKPDKAIKVGSDMTSQMVADEIKFVPIGPMPSWFGK